MTTNPDSALNLSGRTVYLDDMPEEAKLLHASIVCSPSAHGKFEKLDAAAALALDPSVRVILASDIPGENQLGTAVADEELLCSGEWHFKGQVLALVLARTRSLARRASDAVGIVGRRDLEVVTDEREAFRRGDIILKSRTQRCGDSAAAIKRAAHVFSGRADSGGQEHVYLETQGAIAWPQDDGGTRILSCTQAPQAVQKICARVLGLPMNGVEVETRRLGGAFGGKEDQANGWAALAALGAALSGQPVKLYLSRRQDMLATGKRHPYSTDYTIALDERYRITAFEADFYQNSGAATDLSPAILPRTLFHACGAYHVPNVRVTGTMCRTNLVPFTAFRGFGGPQGLFVMECAIEHAARELGVDPSVIQRANLLSEGDLFHYGQKAEDCRAAAAVERCVSFSSWDGLRAEIEEFNEENTLYKRGAALFPLCFGISFTKIMMNQGGALLHVYNDGSVSVSTGAVEMGQGVARKIALVTSRALGVNPQSIRVESTRTITVANTMPTAASTGSDINGMAASMAALELRKRLLDLAHTIVGGDQSELELKDGKLLAAGADTGMDFAALASAAFERRIDLSAHAFYVTPEIHYDLETETGQPFLYHVYGCAAITATLDVLRGSYRFDDAYIVHDLAQSIDPLVDIGQIEGALAQGLGWAALEELTFSDRGELLSNSLSTYKLPDGHFMPRAHLDFMTEPNPKAVAHSKAVGEPPLMYGIAGFFAVLDALRAARKNSGHIKAGRYSLPMSPEKAMAFLYGDE